MRNPIAGRALRQGATTLVIVYGLLGLILVLILPVVGLLRLEGERVEWIVTLLLPVITVAAMRGGARRQGPTAWFGVVIGVLLIAGGVAHLVAVTAVARRVQAAYDSRHVWLVTLGGILVYTGLINIGAARGIMRGAAPALRVAGFATTSLITFLWLLLPLPDGGSNTAAAVVLNVVYLTLLTSIWVKNRETPAVPLSA